MSNDHSLARPESPPSSEEVAFAHSPNGDDRALNESKGMSTQMETIDVRKIRSMKGITWFCVVLSLLSSIFLFALDNTVVADVQPSIIKTLGEIEKLPWISVAFALGAISVNLFWSQLYGNFNSKLLFILGVILFEVGSAVCGGAPTMNALIVGRAICGVGGMGLYLGTMNMMSNLTSEAERPVYLSFVGLTWGLGTVLGPIIGGAFAVSSATWRWSFYINLCVGAAAAPAYIFLLPSHNPRPSLGIMSRVRELDFLGAVLITGALVSLVMAIAFGGGVFRWSSGQIIGLFICTGVLWIAFIAQQAFCFLTDVDRRLFPVDFLKSWEMDLLFAQMAASQVVVYVPIYFIPLYFQFVRGDSALEAGVRLLPFVLLLVFGVIFNGAMMGKLGYYMPWYLLGGILSVIGGALLFTVTPDTSTSRIYGYTVFPALGAGLFSQASFPVAQVKVSPNMIPRAVAFIGCAQIGGIALALAISNSVFLNEATSKISQILPSVPRSVVQQDISGAGGPFLETLGSTDRTKVLAAIVQSIDNIYAMVIAAGGLAVVLSFFMKREKLFVQPSGTTGSGDGEKMELASA